MDTVHPLRALAISTSCVLAVLAGCSDDAAESGDADTNAASQTDTMTGTSAASLGSSDTHAQTSDANTQTSAGVTSSDEGDANAQTSAEVTGNDEDDSETTSRASSTDADEGSDLTSGGEASSSSGLPEGPPDVTCDRYDELVPGETYGDYTLFALRLDMDLQPGTYTVRVHNGTHGIAYIFADDAWIAEETYDPRTALELGTTQTIAFPELFELDLGFVSQADLSTLDDSIFDGCHTIVAEASRGIEAGETYGQILLEMLDVDPDAESGIYTFYTESGDAGVVELRRDGTAIDSLEYDWQTMIGNDNLFTFTFPGVMALTVTRAMGGSNLFAMADSLFDGRHEVVVP